MACCPLRDITFAVPDACKPRQVFFNELPGISSVVVSNLTSLVRDSELVEVGECPVGFWVGFCTLRELTDVVQKRGERDAYYLLLDFRRRNRRVPPLEIMGSVVINLPPKHNASCPNILHALADPVRFT